MAITIERIGLTKDRLGESPVWDSSAQCLWWLDSLLGILHRLEPATGAHRAVMVPAPAGSLALRRGGGILLALRDGFHACDPATGACVPVALMK